MLTVLFEILSILGMLFLILLAVAILFLLLVLFFPITYRIAGRKDKAEIALSVSADWLFGLLRFRYRYPEPGNALIKLLWFTVFDSRHPPENKEEPPPPDGNAPKEGTEEKQPEAGSSNAAYERDKTGTSNNETDGTHEETGRKNTWSDTKDILSFFEKIQRFLMEKYKKMRYTFIGIYDKIKHIRENISYYKALLEDEETRLLFGHVRQRLGRILKSVRPRKLRADILFGADSPDITGYLYGIYGMLSPALGKHVLVTPDFTGAVLEGRLYAAGHITVFHLLWHGGILFFDKRLHLFFSRLKGGRNGR